MKAIPPPEADDPTPHAWDADSLSQTSKTLGSGPPLRRSARQASRRNIIIPRLTPESATMTDSRRNPKRKAAGAERPATRPPGELLDEALAPLSADDIRNWEGWIELESEPAFFNIILRDLGVQDIKAQEVFTMDQASLDMLPNPVFGLIFLFQYFPGYEEEEEEEEATGVWFANQTTDNACATVAMLNIVMNAEGINLGEKLNEFKASTKHLSTPLRGYQLGNNTFIRTIHNSFARRMDHLNADLFLESEVADSKSKKTKRRVAPKKTGRSSRKTVNPEYGYHFIAYVPAGGHVWELDGLQTRPRKLASLPNGVDWTNIARPQIEARMFQYEESQLSFNLLALCQNPLAAHSRAIAQAVASLDHLHTRMEPSAEFAALVSAESKPLDTNDANQLSEFSLTLAMISGVKVTDALNERITQTGLRATEAYALHQELVSEVKAAMGEYRAEMMAIAVDEHRVESRKKDYGPALHRWAKKLAEKGVLEDVIKSTQ